MGGNVDGKHPCQRTDNFDTVGDPPNYKWWPTRKYVQNAPVMHSVYIDL